MQPIEIINELPQALICSNKVRITRLLGKGSFGFVFQGYIRSDRTRVVIKFQQREDYFDKEINAINKI